jgi:hypothetical protein
MKLKASFLIALLWCCLQSLAAAQTLEELRVGHWAAAKGSLDAQGVFLASELELLPPGDKEELIGTAGTFDTQTSEFTLLGLTVTVSERCEWQEFSPDTLAGKRVKVEGRWRGLKQLSARQIAPRGSGRDRLVGRIDAIERRADGSCELSMLDLRVRLIDALKLESEQPLAQLPLAPLRVLPQTGSEQLRQSDEDQVLGSIRLGANWKLGFLLELELENEGGYDLERSQPSSELKWLASLRAELNWQPSEHFEALFAPRYDYDASEVQIEGYSGTAQPHWSEAWVAWHAPSKLALDLYLGRQRFDDEREWLYKRNLDAARLIWSNSALQVEVSASTVLHDGSERDENSTNLMLYVSNRDTKHHLAGYIVDRRDDSNPRDYPFHFGLRAIGEFVPGIESWLELAGLSGYSDNRNLRGWAFDVGAGVQPDWAGPYYGIVGYAWASGDDPNTPEDESFRQTGLQKNNGRFGGVTNYRYYGELLDPELSNLGVATLGAGWRISKSVSLDLIWHEYHQSEPASTMRNAQLRTDPDGVHAQLGSEWDLVLGIRPGRAWDLEFVFGQFLPGAAFPDADAAYYGAFQWRQRW